MRKRSLELWHREHKTWEEALGPGFPYSSVAPLPDGVSDFPVYEGDLYRLQLTGFYVLTDTLVARRREAGDALHFAEDLKTYEDLECFYRLSRRGMAAFLDVDTARQLDHPHGRLSQLASMEKIDARLVLMRRIWGSDIHFLSRHGNLYRRALDHLLCQKAGLFLTMGQNQMATETLALMHSPPLHLRLLSRLPSWLTTQGLKLRRLLRQGQ